MNEETIEFAYPLLLLGLLLLPMLALLLGKQGGTAAVTFSSLEPLRKIGRARKSRAGAILLTLLLLALGSMIVALARPRLAKGGSRVQASGIEILLALDVSRSMLAEDFTIGNERSNRLEAVKVVTRRFIEGRPADRIGIVAFAGRPYLVSPLTLDHDWLLKNLERLRIGLVEDGTAIGSALASATNRIKDKPAKSKIIVLLSDGGNNAGKVAPTTAAEAAKTLGIKVYTIGAGTRGYAPIPVPSPFGGQQYQQLKVQVDEEELTKIANIGGGKYFRATDSDSLTSIFGEIDKLEKTTVELEKWKEYRELFQWFAMAGAALLLAHVVLGQTIWRRLP